MADEIINTWAINIANTTAYLRSLGRRILHVGYYKNGTWTNWSRAYRGRPRQFAEPTTEEKISRLVAGAEKVRVVGAGHSFNAAPLCDDLMLSLDRYKDVISLHDHPDRPGWKVADVQAGIRLRDLNRFLARHELALPIGGSTNFQSIGGLISTDLHGTGRDWGFLSESLLSLRIVDAQGKVATFRPGQDVFHAAIGGAGTCGVIIGAEIAVEPAYNLSKAVRVVRRRWADANLDALLEENTHVSFYYFGGMSQSLHQDRAFSMRLVRMNKWNRTIDLPTRGGPIFKGVGEFVDMVFSGYLIGLARLLNRTDVLAGLGMSLYALTVNHRTVVYPARKGFARQLFFRHDEIEYGLPRENLGPCLDETYALLRTHRFPTIIEVRFTPDQSQALLGPGVGRSTAYIELAPSLSRDSDVVFRQFEEIALRHGGQPHLGKKLYVDREQMDQIYGTKAMQRFRDARQSQDPSGKFLNDFTERVLR